MKSEATRVVAHTQIGRRSRLAQAKIEHRVPFLVSGGRWERDSEEAVRTPEAEDSAG
jgi:hypothetical protein